MLMALMVVERSAELEIIDVLAFWGRWLH